MRFICFLKRVIQRHVNVSRWIDYAWVKEVSRTLISFMQKRYALSSKGTNTTASFEKLIEELSLSEAELRERVQYFTRLTKLCLGMLMLTLLYGCYLLVMGAWLGVISIIALSTVMLAQAFQYHFWAFQIIQRRCDGSLQEWWEFTRGTCCLW